MDIQEILKQVDSFYEENKGEEAEKLMLESIAEAVKEQDDDSLLKLLNELLGYYRETSQSENAFRIAGQALAQAGRMGLADTVPYATTLLNVANAYRAGGKLEESREYYLQVQKLYDRLFEEDNMFVAGLENNLSLLYQEMGEYAKAKECQLKALNIARQQGMTYEIAVTCANLAATCVQMEQIEEAKKYADWAVVLFGELGVTDSHYAAALASLGACHFRQKEFGAALEDYNTAMQIVERSVGRNEAYRRLEEYSMACRKALEEKNSGKGLMLCQAYYETYGEPMIAEQFKEYENFIAVGLVGRGSDCFGYDDEASRDHDWGPDFCMWVTDEVYDRIGEALKQAYDKLPEEYRGYRRAPRVNGRRRRGVMRISDFYRGLLGCGRYEEIDWRQVPDHALAAAVNGKVFRDDLGIFSEMRKKLKEGYPEEIRYLKLAESVAYFAQTAQYNYSRMLGRGDGLTARMMVWDGLKAAMKLQHYIEGKYPPHDKWLNYSLKESQAGREVAALIEKIADSMQGFGVSDEKDDDTAQAIEQLGAYLAMEMYGMDLISDIDSYLDAHSKELVYKASLVQKNCEELAEEIARLEFEAFDKVKNEGGRASCQNDWPTFSIMRKSQYLTWNRTMLIQYLYDFHREYELGHNLIEEKYGRMMESTAPEKYEEIKNHFPHLTEEKKAIIEQICGMQVGWMEEFAGLYPALAENARSIHTYEDNPFDTSYETYLRGELGTYSDKMLELYGRYIVDYAKAGRNLAEDIMGNSVRMYGYESIEEAERKTAAAQR